MAIPDYQACMLQLLRFASDGKEHQLKDAAKELSDESQEWHPTLSVLLDELPLNYDERRLRQLNKSM